MVKIRTLTAKGSTVTEFSVLREAENVLKAAQSRGSLVIDETKDEILQDTSKLVEEHTYAVMNPVAGG